MSKQQPLFHDPWAKREAWRKSPIFSNRAMFRNIFPGFGIAVVAFTGYVIVDNVLARSAPKQEEHGHGHGHHVRCCISQPAVY